MSRSLLKKLTNQRLGALLLLTLLTATTAWADTETVKYIDADGNEQSCTEFTNLTGNETSLLAGWYVVNSDISYTGTINLTGDVHLILKDGCTMNVGTSDAKISGIGITSPSGDDTALNIYGQSGQTGNLNIYSTSNTFTDYGSIAIFGSVTVNGGNVTVRHYGGNGAGIYASNSLTVNGGNVDVVSDQKSAASIREAITINGGNVTANGSDKGLQCWSGNVTINGGIVSAIGSGFSGWGIYASNVTINGGIVNATSDEYGKGIYAYNGDITLGWSRATDCITTNRYDGTVKVADGKKLYNGEEALSGTITDLTKLEDKTLIPAFIVNVAEGIEHGTVVADKDFVVANAENKAVTLTVTPAESYNIGSVTYNDGTDHEITRENDVYPFTMPASNVTVSATFTPINYTITYDLDGGALAENVTNPATYTIESEAITLNNPTRTGYTFAGWTGTGLDAATTEVTIASGSTGNKTYTATWSKNIASVTVGENETYYGSFSAAETAAKAAYVAAQGETAAVVPTLKLYDDIDYGEHSLQIGNGTDAFEMTFDLNGHRFYGEGAEIEIENEGTINSNLIYIAPNAKLTVVDTSNGETKGSIDCTKYNEQCIINFGTLALNGGIVKYSGGQGYVVCNYDGGLLTLDGATINGKPTSGTVHSTGILNAYGSTCNIVSGSIEDCDIAIQNDKGDVNMSGGEITNCRYGIDINSSDANTLNFSGGTISNCSVEGIMLGDQGNLNMTAFPAFSGNSTDIEIRDQRKIKFCAGNYTAPTSKIKVTVDYGGTDPYVFTEGYSTNVKSGNNVIAFDDVFAVTVENKAENATFSFVGEAVIAAPKTFSFAEGQEWSTWCDQYEWTKPEGIEVYDVTGVSNSNVSISLIENSVIPAYKPVLLKKKDSGSLESTIYSVGTAPESYDSDKYVLTTDVSGATLVGNTKYDRNSWPCIYFTELKTYVLYNGKFVLADKNSGLPAHRFWINLDIDGAEINNNNKSRSLSIGGDGTTGINSVENLEFRDESWYSLDGRKLEGVPAKKGLYIHNGKKEVVK